MKQQISIIILLGISLYSLHGMDVSVDDKDDQNYDVENVTKTRQPRRSATYNPQKTADPTAPSPLGTSAPTTFKPTRTAHSAPTVPSLPKSPRANNLEDLKKLKQDNKSSPRDTTIDPAVAATVAYVITYKKDPKEDSRVLKQLTQKFATMETNNPEQYRAIEQLILVMNDMHEGNLTAAGHNLYKSKKYKSNENLLAMTSTRVESSESPKKEHPDSSLRTSSLTHTMTPAEQVIRRVLAEQPASQVLEAQATPRSPAEIEYEKERKLLEEQLKDLADVKKQLKELTHDASEDAQVKANCIAKWTGIAGAASTIIIGGISAVITYYSAINAAHISASPCPPCSTPTPLG